MSIPRPIQRIYEAVEVALYPALRSYGRSDRDRFLRKAAETPFDFIEWAGIFAALIIVVLFTRYSVGDFGVLSRIAVAIVNFLVAIVLLGVIAGPFMIRRTRRGLHSQLH